MFLEIHGNNMSFSLRKDMGAQSSKTSSHANPRANVPHELKQSNFSNDSLTLKEPGPVPKVSKEDAFYDGIPRFAHTLSEKSRSRSLRVSARKAGSIGIEKAVDVLDILGSSVVNLNSGGAFVTGPTTKANQLSILSFEVANTIMKGSSLMQSLSKPSIRRLKEVVFVSQGVQNLVSKDVNQLLTTVAADKRDELKIFTGEVVRFGNRCKDPQWHNLDLYFEKQSRGLTRPKQLKEEPESVMQQLLTLVQHTAELYQELCILDKLEEDERQKHQGASVSKGRELVSLRQDLTIQRKKVRLLKKKSLWSTSMEQVMEKLVDTVIHLNREMQRAFQSAYDNAASSGSPSIEHKLGPAGLALHYANIVLQIDSIVSRSSPMTSIARSTLYQSLPPDIESSMRSKLASFRVEKEMSIVDVKAEMEKILCWLSPVAINTAKAHHGFGWVGEWADTGSGVNRKPNGLNDINRIETLNHADKGRTEAYIVELLLCLSHLITQSKVSEAPSKTEFSNDNSQQPSPTSSTKGHDLELKENAVDNVQIQGLVAS